MRSIPRGDELPVAGRPRREVDLSPGGARVAEEVLARDVDVAEVGGGGEGEDGLGAAVAADAHEGLALRPVEVVVERVVAERVDARDAVAADVGGEDAPRAGAEVDLQEGLGLDEVAVGEALEGLEFGRGGDTSAGGGGDDDRGRREA